MANLKRLSNKQDSVLSVIPPVSDNEIEERNKHYGELEPTKYAKKYNHLLFTPVQFYWNDRIYQIQYNFCTDPFCKWFGRNQERFEKVPNKPSRYRLSGSEKYKSKSIICNPDPIQPDVGMVSKVSSFPYSNWSIAEEISRLVRIETVQDIEPDYVFHKEGCINNGLTPFDHKKEFYKQGKSTSNSQRWQCKRCKKITNVLPSRKQSTTYHQQRNDILPTFAKLLLNKVPISRSCEILEIGVGTYYHKLEWLYRRCLEFLDRYETEPFKDKHFREIWLNTDKMHYLLNNVRKKGQGGNKFRGMEDLNLQTYIVVTSEVFSRYAFRSDVAYDWDITFEELALDTIRYKDDRLNEFSKKNARLEISLFPQEPSKKDNDLNAQYTHDINKIKHRSQYVDGLHVNATYTNIAHYWLIKQLVKANEWRMISDNDSSIKTAFYRVFAEEIKRYDAHHFLSLVDREKSRKQCLQEFEDAKQDLLEWGFQSGYDTKNLRKLAKYYLTELFTRYTFHEEVSEGKRTFNKYANNPVEHPLASRDKGLHLVDCTTDLSSYESEDIAKMILEVNDNATNAFIQQMRRRLSILERPLMTARGEGKSYIYANFNPKYAQYALTILRTYFNFCLPFKSADGRKLTPAQRLGITDKVFDIKDIIYLR